MTSTISASPGFSGERGLDDHTTSFKGVILPREKQARAARRAAFGRTDADLTGLALSGGGIRSASLSLGVLQALDSRDGIGKIDYLSTVSGGGYIGCSLTGCMNDSGGKVPFNDRDPNTDALTGQFGDTEAVRHIRDFSNYLIPRGSRDLITAFGLIARGWAANAMLGLPLLLAAVWLLLMRDPAIAVLSPLWAQVEQWLPFRFRFVPGFPFTTAAAIVLVVFLIVWAFEKSIATSDIFSSKARPAGEKSAELQGRFVTVWWWAFILTLVIIWLEIQPLALAAIAKPEPVFEACKTSGVGACLGSILHTWLARVSVYTAPLAALVAFLSHQIGGAARPLRTMRFAAQAKQLAAKALLWIAAIVVPSLIWFLYLRIALALSPAHWPMLIGLFGGAIFFGVLACFINPNATSLHRLYRDRLSKAFLFNPDPTKRSIDGDRDLAAIQPKLHEIDPRFCPYPIINAALNLEGSAFANRRGRNADFFEFTPQFVGCEATGWIGTKRMETFEPKLDLATAMAISGAAVSPNMGSATIKPLVPTLALLNVRLGFWMRNPRYAGQAPSKRERFFDIRSFLLLKEVFSRIDETSKTVYVTDGGNIENLGVFALLKRSCKLIIVVDAEADPTMSFGSLLKLERYARIDLGVLIDLPWQALRDSSVAFNNAIAKGEPLPSPGGSHIAVGRVLYGQKSEGVLIYVKASLTGDEPDYILDYKSRNPDFPHETTGDQFFGEEQLEVYRALGFHIMRHFLDGAAGFEVAPDDGETVGEARVRILSLVRDLLAGAPTASSPAQV